MHDLTVKIGKLFIGEEIGTTLVTLANVLSLHLAAYDGEDAEGWRREVVAEFVKHVERLTPINERQIKEFMQARARKQ